MDDFALLRDFRDGSEDAFTSLVERHVNAVYSVAMRTTGSRQMAEEVAYSVFNDLARSASRLRPGSPLIAWLFSVTRRTALDALKRERRREARERIAAAEAGTDAALPISDDLLARLDAALEGLKLEDRALLLMRYFQDRSTAEIAQNLGLSAEAAQKRLERALERLRDQFARRGPPVTLASILAILSSRAIQSAPAGIVSAVASAVKVAPVVTLLGPAAQFAFMSTTQKVAVVVVATGLLGTVWYQQRTTARAEKALAAARIDLEAARGKLSATEERLALANEETARLREQNRDIHRLRAELAQRKNSPATAAPAAVSQPPSAAREYLEGIDVLKDAFAASPGTSIPEMSLLSDREWLEAAIVMRESAEDGLSKAMAHLRTLAKGRYSLQINRALQKFVAAHSGTYPSAIGELADFLGEGIDRMALARYEVVRSGTTNEIQGADTVIRERSRTSELDSQFNISLFGSGYAAPPKAAGSDRTYGFSFTSDALPVD